MTHLTQLDLAGTFPAIVTPFSADGSAIDLDSLRSLLDYQLSGGVSGFIVCGSTGEAATLSDDEYRLVIETTAAHIRGRGICVAGIGSNSTRRATEVAAWLEGVRGVDAILLVAPPYNKPPQEGIFAHFMAVHAAARLPIVAYNVPGRTGVNILPATIGRLAAAGAIIALKEASASMDQVMDLLVETEGRISILSGEDSLVHATMACGGRGVVSVAANVEPRVVSGMTRAALGGEWPRSLEAQLALLPLIRALFAETNPIPVKAELARRGLIRNATVRLPLVGASPALLERLGALRTL